MLLNGAAMLFLKQLGLSKLSSVLNEVPSKKKSYFNLVDIYGKGNVLAITINSPIPDDKIEKKDKNNLNFAETGQSR
jgi:hypothetical protein